MGIFETTRRIDGTVGWRLTAPNGEIVDAAHEGFATRIGAELNFLRTMKHGLAAIQQLYVLEDSQSDAVASAADSLSSLIQGPRYRAEDTDEGNES